VGLSYGIHGGFAKKKIDLRNSCSIEPFAMSLFFR
jgi:hypothetical protein